MNPVPVSRGGLDVRRFYSFLPQPGSERFIGVFRRRRKPDLVAEADTRNALSFTFRSQLLARGFKLFWALIADIDVAANRPVRWRFITIACRKGGRAHQPQKFIQSRR